MYIFFVLFFLVLLIIGVILTGIGWYRMHSEDTSEFDEEQSRLQAEQSKPSRSDPVAHLRKKAEEGDARSQFEYGLTLIRRSETYPDGDPNREKAYSFGATWVKMAAKQSYGPALMYCGDENKHLAADHFGRREYEQFLSHSESALKFYRRALEIGYPRALEMQGEIREAGRRIEMMKRHLAEDRGERSDRTPRGGKPEKTARNPEGDEQ